MFSSNASFDSIRNIGLFHDLEHLRSGLECRVTSSTDRRGFISRALTRQDALKGQSVTFWKKQLKSLKECARVNSIELTESIAILDSTTLIAPTTGDVKQSEQDSPARRCLALIAHNNMKPAMQEFVIENKEVLQHFRLTGTRSTMTMLGQVFQGMEIEYGPTMSSGPLGGDAQVAALLTRGDLGGMIFFQDPLYSHPHIADVHSLIRLANVHDILYACNRTTARAMILTLKAGLKDATLIPSFYENLESPSVKKYREDQKALVEQLKQRQISIEEATSCALEEIKRISDQNSGTEEEIVEAKQMSVGVVMTPDMNRIDSNINSYPAELSPVAADKKQLSNAFGGALLADAETSSFSEEATGLSLFTKTDSSF